MTHENVGSGDLRPASQLPEAFDLGADEELRLSVGAVAKARTPLQGEDTVAPIDQDDERTERGDNSLDVEVDSMLDESTEFKSLVTHAKKKLAKHNILTVRDLRAAGKKYVKSIPGLLTLDVIEDALQQVDSENGTWAEKPTMTATARWCDSLDQVHCGALWDYDVSVRGCEHLSVSGIVNTSVSELAILIGNTQADKMPNMREAKKLHAKAIAFQTDFMDAKAAA